MLVNEDFPKKDMQRAKRRKTNAKKAKRKQEISRRVYGHEWYGSLHEYSKNKVHCSCPMCSGIEKTNRKAASRGGSRTQKKSGIPLAVGFGTTNGRKGKNWSVSDTKKLQAMAQEIQDMH